MWPQIRTSHTAPLSQGDLVLWHNSALVPCNITDLKLKEKRT
jgi:hypothetical protein